MSSLAQVLAEARLLMTRLHDREKLADGAVAQSQALNEKINCMKEYQEDLHELNNVSHAHPRSTLVHSLQQENRQIRLLQDDNRQLRIALDEHQTVLELVMQRHRQAMLRVTELSSLHALADQQMHNSIEATSDTLSENQKLFDLCRVVNECLLVGERAAHRDQEELARLRYENATLKQLGIIHRNKLPPTAGDNDDELSAPLMRQNSILVQPPPPTTVVDQQQPCTSATAVIAPASNGTASNANEQPQLQQSITIETAPPTTTATTKVSRRSTDVSTKAPSSTNSGALTNRAASLDKPSTTVNGVNKQAPAVVIAKSGGRVTSSVANKQRRSVVAEMGGGSANKPSSPVASAKSKASTSTAAAAKSVKI